MNIDWRDLFIRYVAQVRKWEGTDYLGAEDWTSDEEWAAIHDAVRTVSAKRPVNAQAPIVSCRHCHALVYENELLAHNHWHNRLSLNIIMALDKDDPEPAP